MMFFERFSVCILESILFYCNTDYNQLQFYNLVTVKQTWKYRLSKSSNLQFENTLAYQVVYFTTYYF